ncbi:hypothetical protein D030_1331B, partial [Vibrio parahaemolyticus AQ3810]
NFDARVELSKVRNHFLIAAVFIVWHTVTFIDNQK